MNFELPKQLQDNDFRFVKLNQKTPFEKSWQSKGYKFNDDKIKAWLSLENNIGVIGGYGRLRIQDIDDKELADELKDKFKTFMVRTGSGGAHFYFKSDLNSNFVLKNDLGEFRANNYQVVAPNMKHPNGNFYRVEQDLPIREISEDEFMSIIKPYIRDNSNEETNIDSKNTRSEREFKEVLRLLRSGKTKKDIFEAMNDFAKWSTAPEQYRELTYNKALDVFDVKKVENKQSKDRIVVMSKFSPVPFAEDIMNGNKFIYDKYGMFWMYDHEEGVWKNNAEKIIRTNLRNNLFGDEQQKKSYVEEVVSYIKELNYDENFKTNSNPYLVAFKNKVYNLYDDCWEDFKPEHYITNKLDIDIDEDITECPKIDKFFCESIGEEYKDVLYDLIAYSLFKRMPYQKIFFVYGPAGTGKSKYMELIESFLGEDNVCSFEPNDIQKDPYAPAQMLYKYANVSSDISYDALDNINQAKKLSGGDTMKIRLMYREPHNAKVYCKQIFSTNKLPEVKEKTQAWYRRVYPIPFYNIIDYNKRNPFLINEMTTKEELQGLAYKCIQHLKRLKDNKFIFTFDIDEQQMSHLYEDLSNPIRKFIRENHEIAKNDSDCWIYQFDFKERLNNWLEANQYPKMTNREINEYMRENFNESNRQNLRGDGVYRVWVGLKKQKGSHNPDYLNHLNHFLGSEKKAIYIEKKFENMVNSVKLVKEEI